MQEYFIYKNSTFERKVNLKLKGTDGETIDYTVQDGDKAQVGIKNNTLDEEYLIKKEITPPVSETYMNVRLSPEETATLPEDADAVFEIMYKYNSEQDQFPIVQFPIKIKGVVNDD